VNKVHADQQVDPHQPHLCLSKSTQPTDPFAIPMNAEKNPEPHLLQCAVPSIEGLANTGSTLQPHKSASFADGSRQSEPHTKDHPKNDGLPAIKQDPFGETFPVLRSATAAAAGRANGGRKCLRNMIDVVKTPAIQRKSAK
jgi:hypothetical protein